MHESPDFFASCARFAGFRHFRSEMKTIFKTILLFSIAVTLVGCSMGVMDYPPTVDAVADKNNISDLLNTSEPLSLLVTVKQAEDGSTYLFFTEDIKFRYELPFTRQYRAMCMAIVKGYPDSDGYCPCQIFYLDALDEGDMTYDASVSGGDGIDIMDAWVTAVDDGYLTLQYSAWFGEHPVKHDFHVVAGLDQDDPYSLELRHDAHSDPKSVQSEGIISFDINSLPDTQGENKTLTLKYKTITGATATKLFEFKTRQ